MDMHSFVPKYTIKRKKRSSILKIEKDVTIIGSNHEIQILKWQKKTTTFIY